MDVSKLTIDELLSLIDSCKNKEVIEIVDSLYKQDEEEKVLLILKHKKAYIPYISYYGYLFEKKKGNLVEAINYLKEAILSEEPNALYEYALYTLSIHRIDEAIFWLTKSSGKGHIPSIILLVKLYIQKENVDKINFWCEYLIKKGDVNGYTLLGDYYFNRYIVKIETDYNIHLKYYYKALEIDPHNERATFVIGFTYILEGINEKEALKLLNISSPEEIANISFKEDIYIPDKDEATKYLLERYGVTHKVIDIIALIRLQIRLGQYENAFTNIDSVLLVNHASIEAMFILGECYIKGVGKEVDIAKGLSYLYFGTLELSEYTHYDDLIKEGYIPENYLEVYKLDLSLIEPKYLRIFLDKNLRNNILHSSNIKIANAIIGSGDIECNNSVFMLLMRYLESNKDASYKEQYLEIAKSALEVAAKGNNRNALFYKGYYLTVGTFYPKDEQEGLYLIQKSAELDYARALSYLGITYMNKHTREGYIKAISYLKRAYSLDRNFYNHSCCYIGVCIFDQILNGYYENEEEHNKLINECKFYLEEAFKNGYNHAYYYLALYSEHILKDDKLKVYYYEQAYNNSPEDKLDAALALANHYYAIGSDEARLLARKYAEYLASNNSKMGYFILGEYHYRGRAGLKEDDYLAFKYLLKSMDDNYYAADAVVLDVIYALMLCQKVVSKEEQEDLFRKVEYFYNQNPDAGIIAYQYCLLYGIGTKVDFKKVRELDQKEYHLSNHYFDKYYYNLSNTYFLKIYFGERATFKSFSPISEVVDESIKISPDSSLEELINAFTNYYGEEFFDYKKGLELLHKTIDYGNYTMAINYSELLLTHDESRSKVDVALEAMNLLISIIDKNIDDSNKSLAAANALLCTSIVYSQGDTNQIPDKETLISLVNIALISPTYVSYRNIYVIAKMGLVELEEGLLEKCYQKGYVELGEEDLANQLYFSSKELGVLPFEDPLASDLKYSNQILMTAISIDSGAYKDINSEGLITLVNKGGTFALYLYAVLLYYYYNSNSDNTRIKNKIYKLINDNPIKFVPNFRKIQIERDFFDYLILVYKELENYLIKPFREFYTNYGNVCDSYLGIYGENDNKDYNYTLLYCISKMVELGDINAAMMLGDIYSEPEDIYFDPKKALYYYKKAYELGDEDAKDYIKEVEDYLNQEEHEMVKKGGAFDIFFSWNHHDEDDMVALEKALNEEGINVWQSNRHVEGVLDYDVTFAINHVKAYVVILSKEAMSSTYMPLEVDLMFARLAALGINSKTAIRVYYLNDYNPKTKKRDIFFDADAYIRNNLPSDHPYQKLVGLGAIFTQNKDDLITFAKNKRVEFLILEYQKKLRESYNFFPLALSTIILKTDSHCEIMARLDFEKDYIVRDLIDNNAHHYKTDELLSHHGYSHIYGEGGSGKSLYLKYLIRSNLDKEKLFFYLPCSEIKNALEKGEEADLIKLIASISFRLAEYQDITLKDVYNLFGNDARKFYIIIDALDESGKWKNDIIKMVKNFRKPNPNSIVNFIFSSRYKKDTEILANSLESDVLALTISPITDEDVMSIFDSVYAHNIERIEDFSITKNDNNEISRDYFASKLALISDDIKKNPLLISNLIYIYFATKEIQTQQFKIIEKSSEIMIEALEEERDTFQDISNILERAKLDFTMLLEYIAYHISISSSDVSIEETIEQYIKEHESTLSKHEHIPLSESDIKKFAKTLSEYFKRRRITDEHKITHDIFGSFFAARYIYEQLYETGRSITGKPYLKFKEIVFDGRTVSGEERLETYIDDVFYRSDDLFPNITVDFISKIDYETYNYSINNRKGFNESDPSYYAYDYSYHQLFSSGAISEYAYKAISRLVEKEGIFFLKEYLKKYLNR